MGGRERVDWPESTSCVLRLVGAGARRSIRGPGAAVDYLGIEVETRHTNRG